MKTQFSWKKKIGAILLAASMLPASAMALSVEEDEELLINGAFQSYTTLEEDWALGGSVIAAGRKIPTDWTIDVADASSTASSVHINGTNTRQLQLKHTGYKAYQVVDGIEPATNYNLLFEYNSAVDAVITIDYLHYDEATDTYLTLDEYAAANSDITLMPFQIGDTSTVRTSTCSKAFRRGLAVATGTDNFVKEKCNFITPPYTNAIRITLSASGISANQYCYFDNLSLKKGNEYFSNGSLENSVGGYARGWYPNCIIKEADAKNYVCQLTRPNYYGFSHRFMLVSGKTYKLSFRYKPELTHEGADLTPKTWVYSCGAGSPGNFAFKMNPVGEAVNGWTLYEGYYTAPANTAHPEWGLINIQLMPGTGNEAGWAGVVNYDDFSMQEVSTMAVAENGGVDINYSQMKNVDEVKLLVASYDKATKRLVKTEIVAIGGGTTKAGRFYHYNQEMPLAYDCKAFLWDDEGNLTPLADSVARSPYAKTLPIDETFSVEGYVPTVADGWTITNPSGTISVVDGKLTLSSDAGYVDNGRVVAVNFDTVETGTIVFETDYYCTPNGCNANLGLANFKSSDGRVLTRLQLDGRGASFINSKANDNAVKNLTNWGHEQQLFRVKIEADLTNKEWRAYQGRYNADGEITYKLLETVLGNSTHAFTDAMANDVCSLEFTLSTAGQYLDNMQIYVIE